MLASTAMLLIGVQTTPAPTAPAGSAASAASAANRPTAVVPHLPTVRTGTATGAGAAPHGSAAQAASQRSAQRPAHTVGGATAADGPVVPSHPAANGKYGVSWALPPGGVTRQNTTAAGYTHQPGVGSEGNLPPGQGPVMHNQSLALIFWLPQGLHYATDGTSDAAYENVLTQWVKDAGGTPYFNIATQYYDSTGNITNSLNYGGSWVDTQAYPRAGTAADPLQQSDITAEVSHAAAVNGWPVDGSHIYAVLTASGIQECMPNNGGCTPAPASSPSASSETFCGYHGNDGDIRFEYLFDDPGTSCGMQSAPTPSGDPTADAQVSIVSHETMESVTDPIPNQAWTDPTPNTGGEIGDKCAYNYTPKNAQGADVYLHGDPYFIQQEWSNAARTCAMDYCPTSAAKDAVCAPQVSAVESVDNPNPVIGSTVTYTVKVQNTSDTAAATAVTVNGPLPSGYVVTGLQAPGSTSSSNTSSSFTVAYDTLPVHSSETVTVTATVPNQVGQPALACSTVSFADLLGTALTPIQSSPCGGTTPGKIPTSVKYTGAVTADYHDAFTASANVSGQGAPVSGGAVKFTLGGASCTGTTDGSGNASCSLTPVDPAGTVTLQAAYAGDATHEASSTTAAFTITREETTLAYTGPAHVANGVPATLSGVLKEDGTTAIAGRSVQIALGTGTTQQSCTGTTGADGTASCTIASVDQPLNDTATVPVAVTFAGDGYYLPSAASATVRLEYYTGRAYGLSANVDLTLAQLTIPPTPDTGPIRTAQASTTDVPCAASVSTLLISADALCVSNTTKLAPGTSTTTSTVKDATIGIPGLPVIGISGLTATSVSSCTGTSGSATLTLTLAGVPVTVPTAPDSVIGLPGGARLVVNEQTPVPGADFGTTVNAVHLIVPGLLGGANTVDVVLGSATSDAHNCS
ncbi:choice-of-anchor P family protein [Streptacidiphilus fuscans]|uniref:Ig-like domain repeat protein n=1 Tax=Streptacidiphilus fuscans TaxID=2789292 RepID=A0A931B615_9ACTN|nr:Ig-like domain repeat protein [Streptacidiphilus fuscans]MBF9069297.1 Ig-like domain repeat protein [Streptacidiphilus fuscans]